MQHVEEDNRMPYGTLTKAELKEAKKRATYLADKVSKLLVDEKTSVAEMMVITQILIDQGLSMTKCKKQYMKFYVILIEMLKESIK